MISGHNMQHWHQHSFFLQVGLQVSKHIACSTLGVTCMHQDHQLNFLWHVGSQTSIWSQCQLRILASIWLWVWVWTIIFIRFSRSNINHSHHQDLHQDSHSGLHHDLLHFILGSLTDNDLYNRLFWLRGLRHQESLHRPHWLWISIWQHRHIVNTFLLAVGISDTINHSKVAVGFSHGLFACGGSDLGYTVISIAGNIRDIKIVSE